MAPTSLLNSKTHFKFKNTYPQDREIKFKFKFKKLRDKKDNITCG